MTLLFTGTCLASLFSLVMGNFTFGCHNDINSITCLLYVGGRRDYNSKKYTERDKRTSARDKAM